MRLTQIIDARSRGKNARQQTHPRRIANRRLTMRIGKQHPAFGQTINIWSSHLWMPLQAANPIIEIINRNKQDIGLGRVQAGGDKSHAKNSSKKSHGADASSRLGKRTARKRNVRFSPHSINLSIITGEFQKFFCLNSREKQWGKSCGVLDVS